MIQSLFTADTFCRIKAKYLGKKIYRLWVRVREESREGHARLNRKRSNVILCLTKLTVASKRDTTQQCGTHSRRSDASESVFRRCTEVVKNLVQLINVTEKRIERVSGRKAVTYSRPL